MKSLAGVAAKTSPLAVTFSPWDGAGAGFRYAAEGLLNDVGEAAAFVAGRGVGAAVRHAAREVFVVPLHFADQCAGNVWCRTARREQMHGVADFGDFAEHDRGARADK